MATDYEEYYREYPHGLGEPTKAFVDFFEGLELKNASVLDVGCGQGRDAIFIARLGHSVFGVDLSPTGISQMLEDAARESLPVEGVAADITDYDWSGEYDVVVIDRTLHMLENNQQSEVLSRILGVTKPKSHVLIADEKSNMPRLMAVLEAHEADWATVLEASGTLFVQRD